MGMMSQGSLKLGEGGGRGSFQHKALMQKGLTGARGPASSFNTAVLTLAILPPGDTRPYLGTSVVVMTGGTPGISGWDQGCCSAAQHLGRPLVENPQPQ